MSRSPANMNSDSRGTAQLILLGQSAPFTVLHCPCQKCPSIRTAVFSAAQRCESRGDRDESRLPCENYSRLSVPAEKTGLFIKSANKTEFPLSWKEGVGWSSPFMRGSLRGPGPWQSRGVRHLCQVMGVELGCKDC